MKTGFSIALAVTSIASTVSAKHGDAHLRALEHRHLHHKGRAISAIERGSTPLLEEPQLEKRTGQCQFPDDAGLVSIPGSSNGGWAMSPDQCCEPGGYCPYACPPGQISMQWDPKATSYSYPQSMNGGLFCDKSGKIHKPFSDKPYCVDGTGNVGCHNKASGNVAICQTVLPGNEAMLIPTMVENSATLAIPGPEYWAGTAAHFYVNPPGVSADEGCIWGSVDKPHGNWSPYVLGGNAVEGGETFIKLGWNPIYLEPATPFRDVKPSFGVEIICEGDGCNGLPCAIDPSQHGVNELVGGGSSSGAGGAVSCVVTVPSGGSAKYVITEIGGSGGGSMPTYTSKAGAMRYHVPQASTQPKYVYRPNAFADNSTAAMTIHSSSAVASVIPSSKTNATGATTSPLMVQSQIPSGAAYTHITAAAFALTALAAVAVVAL
ncbi:MAG: hypothetical protein L6R37_002317 [Teloschistes peruensis]|nr:MAG: hypothetical protein L6R37_002317 [Teloschistes peruensis]